MADDEYQMLNYNVVIYLLIYQSKLQNLIQICGTMSEGDTMDKKIINKKKKFAEDEGLEQNQLEHQDRDDSDDQDIDDEQIIDIDDEEVQVMPINKLENQHVQPQNHPEPTNLADWIKELNQQDHSEDQGIQDYKIGGYHPCHIGEVLINRYVLIQKLGWGHFSTVWLAKDFKYGTYVAVKVMKSAPHYLDASYDQVEILQKIAKLSTSPEWIQSVCKYKNKQPSQIHRDDTHVLNLLNCFLYKGPYGNHFCMVYQILGVNLLEVLKRTDYKGLSLDTVRQMTRQVLIGLDFLNRVCKIIHTDLKPENVLLCLTDDQIKKIVEDGQLNNRDVFHERLRYYRRNFGFGDSRESSSSQQEQQQTKQIKVFEKKAERPKQLIEDQKRLQQLKKRLDEQELNKNTKKTIKKKIKKLEQKIQQFQKNNPVQQKKQEIISESKVKKHKQKHEIRKDILSRAINPKLVFNKAKPLEDGFKIKVADLGNACWTHYHFATEIQTRQYRGPEVILGSKYNTTADLWSLACMTFQMLTGDLLFNPKRDQNQIYGKNDDHIAQMMELLGIFPKKFSKRCSKFRKYFAGNCKLKRVPNLQQWSIKDFMIAKYAYVRDQAQKFEQFMKPMLNCLPQKRASAEKMLSHRWLNEKTTVEKMSKQQHEVIKARDYNVDEPRQEVWNYESDKQDGSIQDNNQNLAEGSDQEWYGKDVKYKQISNIRLIDSSFTDVGYTGYSQGIDLGRLDAISNWQFA